MAEEYTFLGIPLRAGTAGEIISATGGTGLHGRICIRDEDADMSLYWPALKARLEIRHCSQCDARVQYDPLATVYAPGEVIVCIQCFAAAKGRVLPPGLFKRQ